MTDKVSQVFDDWARRGRAAGMEKEHSPAVNAILDDLTIDQPVRFLDFGCGNGWVVRKMADHPLCQEAWGIDVSQEMVAAAESSRQSPKERYVHVAAQKWAPSQLFDLIFSMEALYYSVPMETAMERLVSCLAPGGRIIVGVNYYRENIGSHSWPNDLGVPMDLRSKDEWKNLFASHGLQEVRQEQVRTPDAEISDHANNVHGVSETTSWRETVGSLFTFGKKA